MSHPAFPRLKGFVPPSAARKNHTRGRCGDEASIMMRCRKQDRYLGLTERQAEWVQAIFACLVRTGDPPTI